MVLVAGGVTEVVTALVLSMVDGSGGGAEVCIVGELPMEDPVSVDEAA